MEIKLKELDQKTAEVSTEWSIVPGRGGRPTLVCICPIDFSLLYTSNVMNLVF